MAHINWDNPFFIDPSTGETVPPLTPGAIPFPTYGNYGGGGYSAGEFGGVLITQAGGIPYSFAVLNAIVLNGAEFTAQASFDDGSSRTIKGSFAKRVLNGNAVFGIRMHAVPVEGMGAVDTFFERL